MCAGIEFVLWDILVVLAVILLILWILSLAGVILVNIGPILHIFIVLAIIFLVVWLVVRIFGYRGGRWGRRTPVIV